MQLMNEAFNTWSRMINIGLTTTELMMTSSNIVTKRSELIGNNVTTPKNIEDEVLLMSQEKVDVAMQASAVMAGGSLSYAQKLLSVNSNCFLNSYQGLFFPPIFQSNLDGEQCQLAHWDQLFKQQGEELLNVVNTGLSAVEDNIKPMHECVVNNGKRLKS